MNREQMKLTQNEKRKINRVYGHGKDSIVEHLIDDTSNAQLDKYPSLLHSEEFRNGIRKFHLASRQDIVAISRDESMSPKERKENADLVVDRFIEEVISLFPPLLKEEEKKCQ